MADEQERLERAKQKLLKMNQKVQHAQNITKKRTPVKAAPARAEEKPQQPAQKSGATYIFELTEAMLADGFDEEEVSRYVEKVEAESKASEIELDQRELAIKTELKKITRAIELIKNPKAPSSPDKPRKEKPKDDEKPAASADTPGYSAIHQTRKSPKNEVKQARIAVTPKKPETTPKKTSPRKRSDAEVPAVKATGAGAKFLADLACDDDDDDCDDPF